MRAKPAHTCSGFVSPTHQTLMRKMLRMCVFAVTGCFPCPFSQTLRQFPGSLWALTCLQGSPPCWRKTVPEKRALLRLTATPGADAEPCSGKHRVSVDWRVRRPRHRGNHAHRAGRSVFCNQPGVVESTRRAEEFLALRLGT